MKQEDQSNWGADLSLTIGQNVKKYRMKQKLSAQKLSDATGRIGYLVPRNSITNLENGRKTSVSIQDLLSISGALDVPLASLIASPFKPVEGIELRPGSPIPSVRAYEQIAPLYEHTRPEDLSNDVKLAIRTIHEYRDRLWGKHLRELEKLDADEKSQQTGDPISPDLKKYLELSIRTNTEALSYISFALSQLGIESWHIEEEQPGGA